MITGGDLRQSRLDVGYKTFTISPWGYISQAVTDDLAQEGITLVTGQRKNMNAKELSFFDRAMLSKRFIIEAINSQLKNISQIEHSHHRILHGFMLNLLGGDSYCHKEEKPALNINAGDPT